MHDDDDGDALDETSLFGLIDGREGGDEGRTNDVVKVADTMAIMQRVREVIIKDGRLLAWVCCGGRDW